MTIPVKQIYSRTGDKETIYLKHVIKNPNITVGDFTNLTTCYGVENTNELEHTIGHLMMAQIEEQIPENLDAYIQSKDGVYFIPSSIYLSVVNAKLRTEMGAERMLAEALEPIRGRYDYVLIDTCPSLGMLTINALAAADEVIITVNPQLLAMMGFLHKKIGDLEWEHATRFYGKKAVLGSEVEKIEIQIENYRDNMSILIEKIETAVSDANKAEREAKK